MSDELQIDSQLASEIALAALFQTAQAEEVGPLIEAVSEAENTLTLKYEAFLAGYPGWFWSVTVARSTEDAELTVSESNLLPGVDALVAPEWVPWVKRLAEFRKAQALQAREEALEAQKAAEELRDEDDVDPDEDLLENDFSDYDDELDGVDVDIFDDEE